MVDGDVSLLIEKVSIAVESGVNMVQIREPTLGETGFDELVKNVVEAVENRALTIANPSQRRLSRIRDVDGFQLSESAAITVDQIRKNFSDQLLVGRSVHAVDGALSAVEAGVDFLVFGTIFPSGSHPGGDVHGPGVIHSVTAKTDVPVIGIGGISQDNAGEVIRNGGRGVAVVRSILGSPDPALETRNLLETLAEARRGQD